MRIDFKDMIYWIEKGKLGGMPSPTRKDLKMLKEMGIKNIINLLETSRGDLYTDMGFNNIHIPVPDMFAPTMGQALKFIEFINNSNGPTVAHCLAGRGRTGTMLAIYEIYMGKTSKEAIQSIRKENPYAIESISQAQFLDQFEKDGIKNRR